MAPDSHESPLSFCIYATYMFMYTSSLACLLLRLVCLSPSFPVASVTLAIPHQFAIHIFQDIAELKIGDWCQIGGIIAKPELNNRYCQVKEIEDGRFTCKTVTEQQTEYNFKRPNIQKVSMEDPTQGGANAGLVLVRLRRWVIKHCGGCGR